MAWPLSGTRCARPLFMRSAGMAHTFRPCDFRASRAVDFARSRGGQHGEFERPRRDIVLRSEAGDECRRVLIGQGGMMAFLDVLALGRRC